MKWQQLGNKAWATVSFILFDNIYIIYYHSHKIAEANSRDFLRSHLFKAQKVIPTGKACSFVPYPHRKAPSSFSSTLSSSMYCLTSHSSSFQLKCRKLTWKLHRHGVFLTWWPALGTLNLASKKIISFGI